MYLLTLWSFSVLVLGMADVRTFSDWALWFAIVFFIGGLGFALLTYFGAYDTITVDEILRIHNEILAKQG